LNRHLKLLARDELFKLLRHLIAVVISVVLVHDGRKRINWLALKQDIDLDQVCFLLACFLIVQGSIALSTGFEHVEEVENNLTQRHDIAQLHAVFRQVIHTLHLSTLGLAQLHRRAHISLRNDDRHLHDGLVDLGDFSAWPIRRVVHHPLRTIFTYDAVGYRRRRGNQVEVEMELQKVTGNFHVQKTQEATAETKAQRDGGFWFVGQGGIVKLKLLQRITQSREICLRNWEQTRVHHWFRIGVTG